MFLTLEKLKARLPEIMAAAIRAVRPLSNVHTCPADMAVGASAIAAPPALDAANWLMLLPGLGWGLAPGEHPNVPPERLGWNIPANGGSTHWLTAPLTLPLAWQGQPVVLHLAWQGLGQAVSPEAIVYLDGEVLAGLDTFHQTVLLPEWVHTGEHRVLLRCYLPYAQPFGGLMVQLRDTTIFQLGQTMRVLLEVVEACRSSDPLRHRLLTYLNQAYNGLDLREGWQCPRFAESARLALALLDGALAGEQAMGQEPRLVATGHAHLDVAWLWTLQRTREKAVHTVATALHLMERYPDYHFSMSQPQVYADLKQDAPDLYARLKQRAAEGRFEPVGMMWLEADCNITSGEALVRHLLHGAHFWVHEFGRLNHVLWLPDAFGYSAALPQLLRGCGIACFVTTKLSWNQFNRMPADTFRWRGLDGSEVLVHCVTAPDSPTDQATTLPRYTYVGQMTAGQVAGTWEHYRQQAINDELLYIYGWGDGGGGPTEEMLEAMHLLGKLPGLPQVRPGRVEHFFERLYERVWNQPDLPVWVGELYLEYHRGTYTSQATTKLNNRIAELLYRKAEWLNVWAYLLGTPNQQAHLNEGWRLILRNQFHDILPGSSIPQVYEDSARDYGAAQEIAQGVRQMAQAAILDKLEGLAGPTMPTDGQAEAGEMLYVFNSLPWERQEAVWVALPGDEVLPGEPPVLIDSDGTALMTQVVEEQPGEPGMLVQVRVPSYGYRRLKMISEPTSDTPFPDVYTSLQVLPTRLSNGLLYLELDERGEIVSLYDREYGRELIPSDTTGNQLVTYEDRPLNWDAWDVDPYYVEKSYAVDTILNWRVVETGPLRAAIEIVRRVGRSTIWQRIHMWHNQRRIDFATAVDWQERQTLLRVLFPFDLNAGYATCEIQFGAIERPTHRNTSWEAARFEVCAHRWVDLSEGGYGIALLNDSKYGHSLEHNVLGLSLLRSPVHPDPNADRGQHTFTYSLLPHAGDWRAAQVVRRAYELNVPLASYQRAGEHLPSQVASPSYSFLTTPTKHIVVETIKMAEDGDGVIVRLYEAHNQRGPVCLIFGYDVIAAVEVDLLEREVGPVAVTGRQVLFAIRPFEVKTLRVWFGRHHG